VLVVNEDEAAWLAGDLAITPGTASLHAALGIDVVQTLGEAGARRSPRSARSACPAAPSPWWTPPGQAIVSPAYWRRRSIAVSRSPPRWHGPTPAAGLSCTRRGTQGSMPMAEETDAAVS